MQMQSTFECFNCKLKQIRRYFTDEPDNSEEKSMKGKIKFGLLTTDVLSNLRSELIRER